MATEVKSQQELYDLFIAAVQERAPDLTDTSDGSILDSLAGVASFAASELNRHMVERFNKTFFDTSHGSDITGDADDLEALAVDHFGSDFARPAASKSGGVVTFSRVSAGAGDCTIPVGTIVKTAIDASGEARRFATVAEVTMIATSVNATVEAVLAGAAGNVLADTVVEIESSLTDSSITVNNSLAMSGGEEKEDDAAYRETIRNKIETIRGATKAAIEAAALTVAGVEIATAVEADLVVIEYNIATSAIKAAAQYFRIPFATLYIADANGAASSTLLDSVEAAIEPIRACGVRIAVKAATALPFDWTSNITLNPSGPNFSVLNSDAQMILDSMADYVNALPIGTGFTKATADAALLAIWGPAGTNDLTAFATTIPVGNVAASSLQKLVADDIAVV